MSAVNHAQAARQQITWAQERQAEEGVTDRTVTDVALLAVAHAALAIADQIRVGNALALLALEDVSLEELTVGEALDPVVRSDRERLNSLRAMVREGLGLS